MRAIENPAYVKARPPAAGKFAALGVFVVILAATAAGCSDGASPSSKGPSGGQFGSNAAGGTRASGGTSSLGTGAAPAGGARSSGGSGGDKGPSGGTGSSTGGTTGFGGGASSGGNTDIGGTTGFGGSSASGGDTSMGGNTGSGGDAGTHPLSFTQAEYEGVVKFDFEGEHGHNPAGGPSIGYPCGVPNGYSWKFHADPPGRTDVLSLTASYNPKRYAGAGYDQIYNACSVGNPRKSMPNARIELSDIVVDFFSVSQNRWVRAVKQTSTGGAFAEDFVGNENTGADFRDEAEGHKSVRSGIGNAEPRATAQAGGRVPSMRTVEDSEVGYNFHGFGNRFDIDWADVKAIVIVQAMRCIPQAGTDLSDCNKLGYLGQVGLDSWLSTSSPFDNFQTHGGVSGGVFKPVTTSWQVFTNYSGPRDFVGITPPPVPQF